MKQNRATLPDFTTLAGNLKYYRHREGARRGTGLTQEQAARETEISCSYLGKLETGERQHAAVDVLAAFAITYRLSKTEWRSLVQFGLRATDREWLTRR